DDEVRAPAFADFASEASFVAPLRSAAAALDPLPVDPRRESTLCESVFPVSAQPTAHTARAAAAIRLRGSIPASSGPTVARGTIRIRDERRLWWKGEASMRRRSSAQPRTLAPLLKGAGQ